MSKTLTIPSITPDKAAYNVTIPTITSVHKKRMFALQLADQIKSERAKLDEAAEAITLQRELVDAMESVNADPLIIAKHRQEAATLEAARLKKERELEKNQAKIINYFGEIKDIDVDEVGITYLLISKDILGEPWAVWACCDLTLDDWFDIGYDDYAKICKELLQMNTLFFAIHHQKTPPKK
jgi:hypothetical protein